MKKMKKGCSRFFLVVIGLIALLWVGTRNLSNTHGSLIVKRAEACRKPNNNFSYCTNPSIERAACRNYPVTGSFHPLTCINTATSFYNPKNTCSYCPDFVRMPSRWNFKKVAASERRPGDLIIFYRKGIASHAAVYIGESLLGPLMNQSDGYYLPINYQRHVPYRLLQLLFWEKTRYYRYMGPVASREATSLA